MSNQATITREQYLQQRKDATKVSLRKIILPGFLFIVPLFALPAVFGKERPAANMTELVFFWSLAFVGLVGLAWCYVRMFLDVKGAAIHCPCCGKNVGNFKASQWLIASGKCIKCGGKVFQDSPRAEGDSSGLRDLQSDYGERLTKAESGLLWQSFLVSVPLLVVLIWLGRQSLSPTGPEAYHAVTLLGAFVVWWVIVSVLMERTFRHYKVQCPNCGFTPLRNGEAKVVLSTGGCVKCGAPLFSSQQPGGTA